MYLNKDHLERCIITLETSLVLLDKSEKGSIDYEVYRNAVVKGFELTLETSGKLLRKALKPYFSSPNEVDRLIFMDIFRYAAKHGILTIEEVERWFKYRDNRNFTANDYGAGFTGETLVLMPDFVSDAKKLSERLENEKN
ncbi:MAG: nucleotidyltransferase substrate binding protein [Candidatus Eremiobacteraeota bacterium]|nr:nucleotidyltransferase substrate binding protein [Candidatus Eremiobacteraeota bacterium]